MDKLEKHIKHKLEQLELRPSDNAWEKIESQLGDSKSSERKIMMYWYAVAAVFVGVVIAASVYWGSNTKQPSQKIQMVASEDNSKDSVNKKTDGIHIEKKKSPEQLIEQKPMQLAQDKVLEPDIPKELLGSEVAVQQRLKSGDRLLENQQRIIDQKVDEVFAKVALLESKNNAVTDAEVDSLLMAAQRDILVDKLFEKNGSVDAMALLTEVEDELDRSFRDQIFEALKEGYTKLKTGIADRNN